jgi:hypothetical protein
MQALGSRDIFTGNTYVIWPCDGVPHWAKKASLLGGMFSSVNIGNTDSPLEDGQWFSGNHFWFRSRVLMNISGLRIVLRITRSGSALGRTCTLGGLEAEEDNRSQLQRRNTDDLCGGPHA